MYIPSAFADSGGESGGEEREGGAGGRGEEGMTSLRKKMKELSTAHDVVVRNRYCVHMCYMYCMHRVGGCGWAS